MSTARVRVTGSAAVSGLCLLLCRLPQGHRSAPGTFGPPGLASEKRDAREGDSGSFLTSWKTPAPAPPPSEASRISGDKAVLREGQNWKAASTLFTIVRTQGDHTAEV